jgi:hypothetical protein
MEAGFHDAHVGTDDCGDFSQLEAFVFKEDEGFALKAGQLPDHLRHQERQFLVHPLVRYGDGLILFDLEFRVVIAEAFEGEVAGYRKQVSSDAAAGGVPALGMAEESQEAVLGDVFREIGAAASL